jgi:hypothetical protein
MKRVAARTRLLIGAVILGCQRSPRPVGSCSPKLCRLASLVIPAAGRSAGSSEDRRRFFAKCVANGEHVDDGDAKAGK